MKHKTRGVLPGIFLVIALTLNAQAVLAVEWIVKESGEVAAAGPVFQKGPPGRDAGGSFSQEPDPFVSFTHLVKKLKPAVVNISTSRVLKNHPPIDGRIPGKEGKERGSDPFWEGFERFFGTQPKKFKTRSLGSGVIIDEEGCILTNNHVVEETEEIIVQLSNQKEFKASIVGRDAKTDLALIKVDTAESLPVATLGDSDDIEVGEWVLAIGNPFGFEHSVTAGIVSAKGRLLGHSPFEEFIQTDASINPGNSGGPLFNLRGEVVGINSAIISSAQGLGFAISINVVKDLIFQLREKGRVLRAWLGIQIQEVTEDIAGSFGLSKAEGVLVSNVMKGTPAEKYGLKRGDIILEFEGHPANEVRILQKLVASAPVGVDQTLKIFRDGVEKTIVLKLEEMADKIQDHPSGKARWGIVAQEITPEIAKGLGIEAQKGIIVSEVKENSLAEKAGVTRGDIILEVNRQVIKNLEEYRDRINALKEGDYLLLLVQRGQSTYYIAFRIG